ncbi:sulfate transporter CysZ, partial [Pseudomonas neuropathica]
MSMSPPRFRLSGKAGKVGAFPLCSELDMPAPVLSGPQYLREGLRLVLSPSLRLFVLLPLAINLVLFVGL